MYMINNNGLEGVGGGGEMASKVQSGTGNGDKDDAEMC